MQASLNRDYKAVVVVYLAGGADTFNLVVPHSNCQEEITSYNQYLASRTGAAVPLQSLLTIQPDLIEGGYAQPCATFGIHPAMPLLKSLFDSGEATITANAGSLIEPVEDRTKLNQRQLPTSLYSHQHQQTQSRTLHPQKLAGNGVLGKILDALTAQGTPSTPPYKSSSYAVTEMTEMLRADSHPTITLSPTAGVARFYDQLRTSGQEQYELAPGDPSGSKTVERMLRMMGNTSGSIYAETNNHNVRAALSNAEHLGAVLTNATQLLQTNWGTSASRGGSSSIGNQVYQVARIIAARTMLEAERDVFYVDRGGWDIHSSSAALDGLFSDVNAALSMLVAELKAQGVFDKVTIQVVSDFGRTLVYNGLGTDHAWGGNYFTLSGNLKAAQIIGTYPSLSLVDLGMDDTRNGRLIPTMPWEGIWKPIAQWLGVREDQLSEVMPNIDNFASIGLPSMSNIFAEGKGR